MLSERLRQQRKLAGLSQKTLAELAGVSQQLIGKLETGSATQTAHIVEIAQALGCSPAYLRTGEGHHWIEEAGGAPVLATAEGDTLSRHGDGASRLHTRAPEWADVSAEHLRLAAALDRYAARLSADMARSLALMVESAAGR